jgi:uncharacterized protein (DUF427 family)
LTNGGNSLRAGSVILDVMSIRMRDLLIEALGSLRHEPIEKRVRAWAGDATVVDSTRALLVWEPRRVCPSFAVPEADVRGPLSPAPARDADVPGILHPGIPFAIHTTAGTPVTVAGRTGAGFRLAELDGYVELDFDAFDAWLEEDEEIFGHPRDPFHRIDVRLSRRPVRIEAGGELLAESTRARLLYETNLPLRFYLPREDVHLNLRPTASRSYCPYKGHATYFGDDVCWSYEDPLPDAAPIAGLVAFWDEKVDVWFDGVRRERPGGAVADALRDEFGVR